MESLELDANISPMHSQHQPKWGTRRGTLIVQLPTVFTIRGTYSWRLGFVTFRMIYTKSLSPAPSQRGFAAACRGGRWGQFEGSRKTGRQHSIQPAQHCKPWV